MSKFIVSIGKLFEHGQLICAWSHYICIGNSVYFHAQNNSVGMRNPQQHYCMRKRFFCMGKNRLHAQISLRLVSTLVTPQELYGWEQLASHPGHFI